MLEAKGAIPAPEMTVIRIDYGRFRSGNLANPAIHVIVLIVFAFLLWSLPAFAGEPIIGYARVVDGDTLKIGTQTIRLFGIDAPESKQRCERDGGEWPCGIEATDALREKIAGREISCEIRDKDRYRRFVAICVIAGEDVNRWLVAEGWALAYRPYSTAYSIAEDQAREARRHLWAGEFSAPWDWRHYRQLP